MRRHRGGDREAEGRRESGSDAGGRGRPGQGRGRGRDWHRRPPPDARLARHRPVRPGVHHERVLGVARRDLPGVVVVEEGEDVVPPHRGPPAPHRPRRLRSGAGAWAGSRDPRRRGLGGIDGAGPLRASMCEVRPRAGRAGIKEGKGVTGPGPASPPLLDGVSASLLILLWTCRPLLPDPRRQVLIL